MTQRPGAPQNGVPAKRRRRDSSGSPIGVTLEEHRDALEGTYREDLKTHNEWLSQNQAELPEIIYRRHLRHIQQWYTYALGTLEAEYAIERELLKVDSINDDERREKIRIINAEEATEKSNLELERAKKKLEKKSEKEEKELKMKSEKEEKELEEKYEQKRADRKKKYEQKLADEKRDYKNLKLKLKNLKDIDAKEIEELEPKEEAERMEPNDEQKRADELRQKCEWKRATLKREYKQKLLEIAAENEMNKLKLNSEKEDEELQLKYGQRIAELRRVSKHEQAELDVELDMKKVNRRVYEKKLQMLQKREEDALQVIMEEKKEERQANSKRGEKERDCKNIEIGQGHLKQFLYSLREKDTDEKIVKDSIMCVPDGVYLGGRLSLCHLYGRLLVRTCYVNLCELLFVKCQVALKPDERSIVRRRRFAILGNPGIGKSLFSYYLMYRLIQEKQTIVWQPFRTKYRVLITPTDIEFGDASTGYREELDSECTWYIVDADKPDLVNANTVLITSPRTDIIKPLRKEHTLRLFMPVWSDAEIHLAHELQLARRDSDGNQVSLQRIDKRLLKYGGIPRYVFESSGQEELRKDLKEAANAAAQRLIKGTEIVGDLGDPDPTSHMVVRLTPRTEDGSKCYRRYTRDFASPFVKGLVQDCLNNLRDNDLLSFLNRRATLRSFGSMAGMIFEVKVHQYIEKGGIFKVRKLDKETVSTTVEEIEVKELTRRDYKKNIELTAEKNVYWIPLSKTNEAFDSLKFPNMLFQITIAHDHPVKKKAIVDVVERIRQLLPVGKRNRVIRFYFVVPSDEFATYAKQNYLNYRRHVLKGDENDIPGVEQYVMRAPFIADK